MILRCRPCSLIFGVRHTTAAPRVRATYPLVSSVTQAPSRIAKTIAYQWLENKPEYRMARTPTGTNADLTSRM